MRLVIKIGSSLLAARAGGLAESRMRQWAKEIAGLRRAGHEVILVSSGAIRAGMQALGWKKRPTSRPQMQACATVGPTAPDESLRGDAGPLPNLSGTDSSDLVGLG